MIRKVAATTIAGLLVVATASLALCAQVVGTVSDTQGNPVQGVQITAQTPAGKVLAQALSGANGQYQISGLNPGTYKYALNPLQTGFKAGTAVSDLGPKGLTINWTLSATVPAIALASEGTEVALAGDPFGMTWPGFLGFDALVAAGLGGVVGGVAAAGGFSGSSSPASPSL